MSCKPNRFYAVSHPDQWLLVVMVLLAMPVLPASAAIATKASSGTDLTSAGVGVWSGGSGANGSPTSADVATWTSSSLGAGLTLGSVSSWGSINVSASAPAIAITGAGALTLTNGIILDTAAGDMSFGNPITLGANQTWNIGANRTLTTSGAITGSRTLVKDGAGTLIKSSADGNTGMTITAGTVKGKPCGVTGTVTVNGGIWDLAGTTRQVGIFNGDGGQVNNSGAACTLLVGNGGGSGSYAGVIAGGTGVLSFRKQGAGTNILTGTNTFTGTITIDTSSGPLSIGGAGQLGSGSYAGAITLNGGTFSYDSSANQTLSGAITGAGSLVQNGPGTLSIPNSGNGYSGGTTINAGTLAGKPGSINSADLRMNGGTFDLFGSTVQLVSLIGVAGAQIVNNGAACTLNVGVNSPATPGTFAGVIADGTGALSLTTRQTNGAVFTLSGTNTFSGIITIYAAGTLNIGGSGQLGSGVYDGNIGNSGTFAYSSSLPQTLSGSITGTGALTQNGPGMLTLLAANTYSGTTTVGGGILAVSSAQTGTGAISVSDGATLKVNVSGASQLRPSALTVGSSAGGTLEFNGITSRTTAPLNVTGALTINGSCSVKIDSLPSMAVAGDSYPLVTYGSGGSGSLTLASLPTGIAAHLTTGSSPIRLVVDDLPLPRIGLSATTPLAKEGGNPGSITLTRIGKTNQIVTVGYSISGTASNGVDYAQLSGVVNLAAGQMQSVISINALIDATAEPMETVTLTLSPSGNYDISGLGSASVLIIDASANSTYSMLVFDDEFNGPALDTSVWYLHSGRTNVAVTNGSLELIPRKYGTDWVEGSIATINYAAKYGYYECRMKVNDVDGMNNSFWLNTPADVVAGNNIDRFEIDITEAKHKDGRNGSGIWDNAPKPPGWGAHGGTYITNISDIYRTITLEWKNDNSLTYSWDGVPFYTNDAPTVLSADTMIPVSVLCSALVASFAGQPGPGLDGSRMYVDYVRIWQKPGWTGAFNGNWGSGTNWGPDGVPGSGEAAIFNGPSTNTAVSLAADKFCHSLCFDNAACPAFTFPAGAYSLHLGAAVDGIGGITICTSVTNSQTVNLNLVADRDLQFGNFSRTPETSLFLNGNIDGLASGKELHFTGYAPIQVGGALSANIGNIIKWGPNTVWLTGTNAQNGSNLILDGVLVAGSPTALGSASSATVVSNGASLVFVGGIQYLNPEPLSLGGIGDMNRSGALDVEGVGKAVFSGPVTLRTATTIAGGATGSELELAGPITGAFAVTKTGTGMLTLSGNNSYSGATTVTAGGLTLNGTSASAVTVSDGTLAGSGVISNNVTLANSIHTPGNGVGSQTIYGDYTLGSGSVLRIEISSTNPVTQSDRVRVLGGTASTVTLAGALEIIAPPGLTNGTVITVIENDGTDAVSGTFSGLPQNYAFSAAGYWWRVSYTGGDGNDMVVTMIAPPAPQLSAGLSGSIIQLGLVGEIGYTFEIDVSTNLVNWAFMTNVFNVSGTLLFTDPFATNYNLRFYRAVLLP